MTDSPNPNVIDTDSLTGEMHPIRRAVLSIGSNLANAATTCKGPSTRSLTPQRSG